MASENHKMRALSWKDWKHGCWAMYELWMWREAAANGVGLDDEAAETWSDKQACAFTEPVRITGDQRQGIVFCLAFESIK